ncbi:hypothetical protein DV515_00017300 [Chloebia gouldiae]|uniref:Rab11 family-interacting protein 5 n=1 Tax=Chloebia gouldiae TaxID=44316 RepID=A0A3L8QWE1_CHLGU|nr:hypothetical protein DV515_00017297 [Chloebia gouldiae]RLV71588.1 hypothetical protein DV515_00017300 [Chloebia gouldiae]
MEMELQVRQGGWHKLHSKAGKKEKERGEILVSIQFTRNSLTASMFDLSAKDKPRSPFGRFKDKVTGKKKYDLESASAIIPSSMGALDVEDDLELGGNKSKLKGFFLKNKLRKSSLTQSSTSLGSDSTISSASLSLAANVPEVAKSPSRHGSLSTEHSGLHHELPGSEGCSGLLLSAPRSNPCQEGPAGLGWAGLLALPWVTALSNEPPPARRQSPNGAGSGD